jgi:DNA-binding GntR family transcriptional regulator
MDSSTPHNRTATAVCESSAMERLAPSAALPQASEPLVTFLQAETPEAELARPRDRRPARPGQRAPIAPSRHDATRVREYAYRRLKTLVLSGRFPPGQRLTEERLSRDLGTSRTPIREALHKLQLEGLIASLPTRGFAASRDSQADIDELLDLRAVLEGYALRVICGRLTEPQLRKLDAVVRRTEEAVAARRLEDVSRWNARFHRRLHALIRDKRRIHEQLVTMRQFAFRYGNDAQPQLDAGRRTAEGHRRILTALRMRDPDLCERAMREHIRRSPATCLRRERPPAQPRAIAAECDTGTGSPGPR